MNEKTELAKSGQAGPAVAGEFGSQVELAVRKCSPLQRPFFVVLLQINGLDAYRARHAPEETNRLLRDLYGVVRRAVHASQYVGVFRNGLGVVFDAADPGQVDLISQRLVALCQQAIRSGHYNELTSKWSDILLQFLSPSSNPVLVAQVGWSIYPRDGMTSTDIIKRAWAHLLERSR